MIARRVFITGGTGFFGKSMLDYRRRHPEWSWAKAEWVVLSRSPEKFILSCPELARQDGVSFTTGDVRNFVFPNGRFDAIVHAATSVVTKLADEEMASVIVDGTRHVIDFAKTVDCDKILFTSSGAVYGPRCSPVHEDDECCPDTVYGRSKLVAERFLLDSGMDVKIARCFAFVGPYLDLDSRYAIGNFISSCIQGRSIVIKDGGTQVRSYLYADDLVEWLFGILELGKYRGVYNVGSEQAVSIIELAHTVKDVMCSDCPLEVLKSGKRRKKEVYVPLVDKVMSDIGLTRRFSLRSAIGFSIRQKCFI